MQPPTLQDVYRARQVISRYLPPTPLVRSAAMSEGLMTRVPFDLTLGILRDHIDDIVLVSEEELRQGVRFLLEVGHQLAEAAPRARGVAAARKLQDRLRGRTVVLIVSGSNITLDQLRRVLTDPQPW